VAAFEGTEGIVYLAGTPIGQVSRWMLQFTRLVADSTEVYDLWKKYTPTVRLYGILLEGFLDTTDPEQREIMDQMIDGQERGLFPSVKFDLTAGGGEFFEGNGTMSAFSVLNQGARGVVRFACRIVRGYPQVNMIYCPQMMVQIESYFGSQIRSSHMMIQVEHN